MLGANAKPGVNNVNNQIVIGYNAVGKGSNTAVLGNDNMNSTFLNGDVKINNGDLIVAENGNQTGGNVYFKDIDKTTYPNYSKLVIDTTAENFCRNLFGSNTNNWENNGMTFTMMPAMWVLDVTTQITICMLNLSMVDPLPYQTVLVERTVTMDTM